MLYVSIPGALGPLERGEKFQDPLDAFLRGSELGEVTGGGPALEPGGRVASSGIDVKVYDVTRAVPALLRELRKLEAPKGTKVEELRDDEPPLVHPVW